MARIGHGTQKTALLLGGGVIGNPGRVRKALAGRTFALVVCADAGLHHVASLALKPTHVVGDFDSVADGWQALAPDAEIHHFSADKDETDLQLAVELAMDAGATRLVIVGATGGRLDHALGNVLLLPALRQLSVAATLLDDWAEAWVAPAVCEFEAAPGQIVSLIPLTPEVTGVTVRGLRYELTDATLRWGSTLSISNAGIGGIANVRHNTGTLLVVRCHVGIESSAAGAAGQ